MEIDLPLLSIIVVFRLHISLSHRHQCRRDISGRRVVVRVLWWKSKNLISSTCGNRISFVKTFMRLFILLEIMSSRLPEKPTPVRPIRWMFWWDRLWGSKLLMSVIRSLRLGQRGKIIWAWLNKKSSQRTRSCHPIRSKNVMRIGDMFIRVIVSWHRDDIIHVKMTSYSWICWNRMQAKCSSRCSKLGRETEYWSGIPNCWRVQNVRERCWRFEKVERCKERESV